MTKKKKLLLLNRCKKKRKKERKEASLTARVQFHILLVRSRTDIGNRHAHSLMYLTLGRVHGKHI